MNKVNEKNDQKKKKEELNDKVSSRKNPRNTSNSIDLIYLNSIQSS